MCNLTSLYCRAAQVCGKHALHPTDLVERAAHADECTARHERLAARSRSATVECGICLERVLEKHPASARTFGLLVCEHAFCLGCIKSWRSKTDGVVDLETARILDTGCDATLCLTLMPALYILINSNPAQLPVLQPCAPGSNGCMCFYCHSCGC